MIIHGPYLGDFVLESTVDFKFTTLNVSEVPTTLAGTPVVSVYDDNNITQITSGVVLSVDFDGVTGLHNVRVSMGSGDGYAEGHNYQVVITTGTVNSVSVVGTVLASFSIKNRMNSDMTGVTIAAVTGSVGGVTGLTASRLDVNVSTRAAASSLSTMASVLDGIEISVDAILSAVTGSRSEPAQGAPPESASIGTKIDYLYKFLRNRKSQTTTQMSVYNDDGVTVDHKATTSDNGTTYVQGEVVSGP